jgi:hypothetical protein
MDIRLRSHDDVTALRRTWRTSPKPAPEECAALCLAQDLKKVRRRHAAGVFARHAVYSHRLQLSHDLEKLLVGAVASPYDLARVHFTLTYSS